MAFSILARVFSCPSNDKVTSMAGETADPQTATRKG
jgi:hypothetical protein